MDALLIEHDAVDIRLLREYVDKLLKDAFTQKQRGETMHFLMEERKINKQSNQASTPCT